MDNPEKGMTSETSGASEAVSAIMRGQAKNAEVQEAAVMIPYIMIGSNVNGKKQLVTSGAFEALVGAMRRHKRNTTARRYKTTHARRCIS